MNYLGTLFSATLVLHLITKLIFNIFAKVKMPLDMWTIIDFICSAFNIICFNVIGSVTPSQIIDPLQKQKLDYYVIAVVVVSWFRFFGYFLMIRSISKLVMTLIKILYETLNFIFIVICWLLLMATVFTMLFQYPDPNDFGEMSLSFENLFSFFTGQFWFIDTTSASGTQDV